MEKHITASGFIFDVDATLVDTTRIIDEVWQAWAGRRGVDFADVLPHVHGRKVQETLALVRPEWANADEEAVLKNAAMAAMERAGAIAGALDFVRAIPAPLWAIATSGPRKIAETSLRAAGFALPGVMVCGEDVLQGKPAPEPFALAARLLGIPAARCIAFEDSPAGVASAKAAGCFTVALLTSHPRSQLGGADAVVAAYSDLRIAPVEQGFRLHY